MSTLTVRMATDSGHADCVAVDFAVRDDGASVSWSPRGRTGLQYGCITGASEQLPAVLSAVRGASIRAAEIIAVAVYPSVPEALPAIADALGGPGAPSGVCGLEVTAGGIVVEWDPSRTAASTIYGLIDIELTRFAASRVTELLTPLGDELLAQIAAHGLRAPELQSDRILERALERSGVLD
ncbi:MAG: hypothetical protein ACYDGM_07175 [Vulcanimicrobiaceae bacterium]